MGPFSISGDLVNREAGGRTAKTRVGREDLKGLLSFVPCAVGFCFFVFFFFLGECPLVGNTECLCSLWEAGDLDKFHLEMNVFTKKRDKAL
jgi:hypothetical protein